MNPWSPYQPTHDAPWNLKRVVHLHRRAAFAAPWSVLLRDLSDGPVVAVGRILDANAESDQSFVSLSKSIGTAAVASGNPSRLKAWWIYRMLLTPDPLGERLTLMWHNHFATSNLKVDNLLHMHQQNEILRSGQRGKFRSLLAAVLKHPAMLAWLDADANRKGHPNENLGRELLELFTLGIGNYSEDDVRESARSLTGWTIVDDKFAMRPRRHDDREKTVLGRRDRFDGDRLIEHICDQPATAQRISWRICQTLLGEGVATDDAIGKLADTLRKSSLDIDVAVATVLKSQLFFSDKNIRTRICGPVEYVIGAFRSLNLQSPPPSTLSVADWSSRMGQDLFYPPNVGGWNAGRSWLSTRSVLARANFAYELARGEHWNPVSSPDWSRSEIQPSADQEKCVRQFGELLWGDISDHAVREIVAAADHSGNENPVSAIVETMLSHPNHLLA